MVAVKYELVPDWPDYRVGTDGSVWSRRTNSGKSGKDWHRLKPSPNCRTRYLQVSLGKWKVAVHTLVLLAFVGPRPEGKECRHWNGDRSDNRLVNLSWASSAENAADRHRHGTSNCGERHTLAKLREYEVKSIPQLIVDEGMSHSEVAEYLGVSASLVNLIFHRKAWRHITAEVESGELTPLRT